MKGFPTFCNPTNNNNNNNIEIHSAMEVSHSQREPYDDTNLVPSLSEELNKLSVEERNRVYEEMHGVAQEMKEMSHDQVLLAMNQMNNYIFKRITQRSQRKSLERAFYLRPSLKKDVSFYRMFLRAKRFDVQEAAECMCAYFTNKSMLFGDEALVEKITLEHLKGQKENELLQSGSIQVLKGRESTGRLIQISSLCIWDISDWKSFAKYSWYVLMSAIEENDELQKRGFVNIVSLHGSFSLKAMLEHAYKMKNLNSNWPVFTNGIHICYNDPTMHVFLQGLHSLLPRHARVRQRLHQGSVLETKHALMTFGMNVLDCFEEDLGILSPNFTTLWIQERQAIEEYWRLQQKALVSSNPSHVLYPSKHDIIMGRSIHVRDWPGNQLFHLVIAAAAPRYAAIDQQDRLGKTMFSIELAMTLRNKSGTRFLERKLDETGWQETSDHATRIKVAQALRNSVNSTKI